MRKGFGVTIGIVAFLLLIFGGTLVTLYTDLLWFGEVGYKSVYWTELISKLQLGVVAGVLFFLIVYLNLWIARKFAPPSLPRYDAGTTRLRMGRVAQKGFGFLILGITLFVSVMVALEASSHWMGYQMFIHATPFGTTDPIFHQDIGFYIFKLGFLQYIYGWIFFALVVAVIATAAVHYTDRAIDFLAGMPTFAPHVKAHLSLLFAAALFVKAWGYRLDAYSLLYSPYGKVFGAGYTDVHARLFALKVLVVVAILAGILALVNINRRGIKLPAAALIILVATSILLGSIYPGIVQQVYVQPNEIARESEYINNNIKATRHAFNIDKISIKDFPATTDLTVQDIKDNSATINSVRLWDYRPLASTFNQLQALGLFYHTENVDVDRYTVKDQEREVMLAARELSIDGLTGGIDSWVNSHFQYTHGYGAIMSPVNEARSDGSPSFFVSDMPVSSPVGIDIDRPQIYFGEKTNDYVVVNSDSKEFDHPTEGGSAYTKYAGKGGIDIGNVLNRMAFALRFADTNLILNNPITAGSRLMFRRNIAERVQTIFPFLLYDHDPYLVISKGKLFWIQDAYTYSDQYPYSTPMDWNDYTSLNYIRNSVKIVIDAYSGSVDYYVSDTSDPMLRTYMKIFPGVFKPMSGMAADLKEHIRYPEDIFNAQSQVMLRYHVQDPQIFYTGSDRWEIPKEITGSSREQNPMESYYVVMTLPKEQSEEFLLMRPFTPANKNNMSSWMAARCDPKDYGKLVLYLFPTQKLVYGPSQIESRIDQDPTISQKLTLWSQQGSSVNRGNMMVIPIQHSLMYIKPLYLESTTSKIPQLTAVIVAYGDKIEMADTLNEALNAVFGSSEATSQAAPAETSAPTQSGKAAPSAPTTAVRKLIDQAFSQYNRAQDAQRKGDWAAYGEQQKQLQQTLKQLKQTSGR